jgi:phenylpyruvate tautomerase PptA (4-oxalocrotonate tautomerase family)
MDGMGFLKVKSNPSVPTVIFVNGIPMDGWAIKRVPLLPGEYEISFSDVVGYATPAPIHATIAEGNTANVVADFAQLGLLRVVTNPAVLSTIMVDDSPRDEYGLWLYVVPGMHNVSFGPVPGYDAPANQMVQVYAGHSTYVTGKFAENPNAAGPSGFGYLRVTSSPALPTTISVDGIPRDTWGLSWLKLSPGTHVVSFSDVSDHLTPAPITVEVKEGEVTEAVGSFVLEGGLTIVTAPPKSATIYIDGVARDSWGVWLVLPEGRYTISFGNIPGQHVTPAPQSVLVIPGQITLVIGQY